MKIRKSLICLLAVLFVFAFAIPALAAGEIRVDDRADIFTDSEEYELTNAIDELVSKYGMDFMIYTDTTSGGLDKRVYAADYYEENGYGIGADADGSLLFICMEPGNRGWRTVVHGEKCQSYYNSEVLDIIDDAIEEDMQDGAYYSAMKTYISKLDELYSTGTVKAPKATGMHAVIGAIIALISGGATAGALTSGMKKVRVATDAGNYLVRDSFHIRKSRDHFLYMNVTRIKREKDGGGKSGFGGFSSSSGGSFTGGGRDF